MWSLAAMSISAATLTPDDIDDSKATIKIIYPKPNQLVGAVDSTFILGNVPAANKNLAYILFINGQFVPVHRDGGFIAFLPVTPGDFQFIADAFLVDRKKYRGLDHIAAPDDLRAQDIRRHLSETLSVKIPQPLKLLPPDSLLVEMDYNPPLGNLSLGTGDRLKVSFKGTPGCRAWFSIDGVVDSVPMAEASPRTQPYWGEAVFGAGAVPESLLVNGIYSGFYDIPSTARCDTARVRYYLAPPASWELHRRMLVEPAAQDSITRIKYPTIGEDSLRSTGMSSYRVTLNDPAYPFTVRFSDSVLIMRHGPLKGYFSIFQPKGVEALAVAAEGDWYRVKLSLTQYGWVNKSSVEILPKGLLPPTSYISSVRSYNSEEHLSLEFPLAGRHPFRIIEDDLRHLRIQLFGVTSSTDWIRYDFSDTLIELASWAQPEEGLYEFHVTLKHDLWGYDTYYTGNTFYFQLNKPPRDVENLQHKRIVIDPGHSSDPGAIGPTGYLEAEANLGIARAVADLFRSKGADVIMTRSDDRNVELYDRPVLAKAADADIFISIHNNALPDGVNPVGEFGSSTYYYHPHSIDLARCIQAELTKATGLADYGLYHGNLAVARPTQYPAVLVECAFMILPEQEALLKESDSRSKIADAIVKGVQDFLKDYSHGL